MAGFFTGVSGIKHRSCACVAREFSLQLSTLLFRFALFVSMSQSPRIYKWNAVAKRMLTKKTETLQGGKPCGTKEQSGLWTTCLPHGSFHLREFLHFPKIPLSLCFPSESKLSCSFYCLLSTHSEDLHGASTSSQQALTSEGWRDGSAIK